MIVVDCGGEAEGSWDFVDEIFAEIDGRILVEPVAKVHEIRPVKFHRAEVRLVEQNEERQGGIIAFEVENAEGVVNAAVVLVESFGERIVVADEIAFGSPALFDGNRDVAAGAGVVDSGGDFVETENVGENVADRSFAGARFAVENGEEILREADSDVENVGFGVIRAHQTNHVAEIILEVGGRFWVGLYFTNFSNE